MSIDYCELIKEIEGEGLRIVRVKLWRGYNSLSVELSPTTTGEELRKVSERFNGLETEYNGQSAIISICRRI